MIFKMNSSERNKLRTVTLFIVAAFIIYITVNRSMKYNSERNDEERRKLESWMKENNLQQYRPLLKKLGVTQVKELSVVKEQDLDKNVDIKFRRAIKRVSDKVTMEYILDRFKSNENIERLEKEGIRSVFDMCKETKSLHDKGLQGKITQMCQKLKDGSVVITKDDIKKWLDEQKSSSFQKIVIMVIGTSALTGAVMLLGPNLSWLQNHSLPISLPTSKTSIFDFFTGRYPAPQSCTVEWDWEEPMVVGKTVSFRIKFFLKNGASYPISSCDNILVEIMHQGIKVAHNMEFGFTEPGLSNVAKVSFAVHKSGDYNISVMIGARHIKGSPFNKVFEAGPVDAGKTGFMNYSSTVVCTTGSSHPLTIETRDSFGNQATYKTDQSNYFKIKVVEAGTNKRYIPTTQIIYDPAAKRLTMHIKMEREGCYQATVSYGDVKLKNGDFDILVLNQHEMSHVNKNLAQKSHSIWYKARLISYNNEKLERPKKVYVYISPKQLTLKEFYFKIIGKKLCTFRVCPSTKFYFSGFDNHHDAPTFTIDDGSQPPVVLAAKDRNSIAATFTSFLLRNIGGSETFLDKQVFFYQEVRSMHAKRSYTCLPIKIDRNNLLQSSFRATKNFELNDWCKRLEVTFEGEEGLDWGGVRREWIELLCSELFDPKCSGLFERFEDSTQGLVHPNPKRSQNLKLKYYEFAGKIVGKCLYDSAFGRSYRQLVKARFSRSFLAQVLGLRVNYKYFESDDPELYKTKIQFIEDNDISDMDLTFSEDEYSGGQLTKVIEYIPNGARTPVTNRNKLRYLDVLAQYRLATSVKDELEAFLKGLNELIPDNLLSIFDENELELLMCGTDNYSIADFKLHHTVCGTSPQFSKVLDWFWTIVAGFTEEQMARLLQFITGCSQLPVGGFSELRPKIQLSSTPMFNVLPSAHTCFNQLCLPFYDTIENFHHLLLLAINEGSQGFGMA